MNLQTIKNQLASGIELNWYYKAYLVSLFHHIKQHEHGGGKSGRGPNGWSIRKTAKELHLSIGSVHNYLRLADAIAEDSSLKELPLRKALKNL